MFDKTFTGDGRPFQALHAAEMWLKGKGYSSGRMCGSEPIGIAFGVRDIQKWINLSPADRANLDGTIEGDDRRNGPVTVRLKKAPDADS